MKLECTVTCTHCNTLKKKCITCVQTHVNKITTRKAHFAEHVSNEELQLLIGIIKNNAYQKNKNKNKNKKHFKYAFRR